MEPLHDRTTECQSRPVLKATGGRELCEVALGEKVEV